MKNTMKNVRVLLLGSAAALLAVNCLAATYEIPVGSISDHSNANTPGSIAWYMARHGADNTYNLSSSATYYCNNTLYVPAGATLGEKSGVTAVIRCSSSWVPNGGVLINMNSNWCCVRDLELNGDWKPQHVVWASGKTGVQVRSCTVHKTKKINGAHLIVISGCSQSTVTGCLLRRAGCDTTDSNFNRMCVGIYALGCNTVNITWDDIAVIASHGVDLGGSLNILVSHNQIHDIGRAMPAVAGDGISGYHNLLGYSYLNWTIEYNDVWDCQNHGIHVSGRDVHVENNEVWGTGVGHDITLWDWRTTGGQDCCSSCTILNNYCGSANIVIDQYKPGTISVSGNYGPHSNVAWYSDTCQ